jgi:beta-mannosidase
MKRVDLNGKWQFKAISSKHKESIPLIEVSQWMPATVPGTVHTDLLGAGKIPDPFYRMNELDAQWVDREQWHYHKEFTVGKELLDNDEVYLVAEGLDTYAVLKLNGQSIGRTADMFVEHRFNVKRFIKIGTNVLDVVFDSPTIRSKQLQDQYGELKVSHEPQRVYVRKAQYSFGWDWGPKLTTSGIWRPIYLEAFSSSRIKSVFARTTNITKDLADVRVDVDIEHSGRKPVRLSVEVTGEGFEFRRSLDVRGASKSFVIKIPKAHLWWPNGYGNQSLYHVRVFLKGNEAESDEKFCSFGIRTVRLLQEKDEEGKSFILEVNGQKIYCKGADWIPSDSFIPRIPTATYDRLLTMARDANMNMVRVWGGGIYEQEVFYDLCDRLGLMVWQDFMFACGEYPENGWFLQQVKDEAEKAVTRLRNHPSIALWCGNNECEWIFCKDNPGKEPDDMNGATIFRDVLPTVCRKFDGTRPYWRSSPFGIGFPNDESNGNHHQWAVWGLWLDYPEYEKDRARFVTEFGFQAPAYVRTMEPVTLQSDRQPQSRVLEHHNKLQEGTERLYRFQASHYPVGGDYEEFVYKGQLVQAEALKTAVEHWRRRKFKTAGSMFWQLNDCWPVTSWSVIDSGLRPKAAYYFAKKFFAPVLVSVKLAGGILEVWGTSDLLEPVRCELDVSLWSFDGPRNWSQQQPVSLGRNASKVCLKIKVSEFAGVDTTRNYVLAQLRSENRILAENRFFFVEPKHLQCTPAPISTELKCERRNVQTIELYSEAFAKNVRLECGAEDLQLDDNYFDLEAGVARRVSVLSNASEETVRKNLKVRALFHGWGP